MSQTHLIKWVLLCIAKLNDLHIFTERHCERLDQNSQWPFMKGKLNEINDQHYRAVSILWKEEEKYSYI